jgi:lipoate-protein ligase A
MLLLDLTLPTPAENLAADEALLDWREAEPGPDILRFWTPDRHFVVVGYANKVAREVDVEACRARQVPILRRCTGGGAVLQGPGCLNYALILNIEQWPGLRSITQTNCFIMQRHAQALASLPGRAASSSPSSPREERVGRGPRRRETDKNAPPLPSPLLHPMEEREKSRSLMQPWLPGGPVTVEGFTDLALNGLKFSGNAQRRKRRCLLFHGTFLLDLDLSLVEKVLRPPSRQPAYRENRSHAEFLTRLGCPASSIKAALQKIWNAKEPLEAIPNAAIGQLVQAKYATEEWYLKW